MMSEIVRTFRVLFILWKAFFKYNAIVSTNKLPLNSLIVVLNIFFFRFYKPSFSIFWWCIILYTHCIYPISNAHLKLHVTWIDVKWWIFIVHFCIKYDQISHQDRIDFSCTSNFCNKYSDRQKSTRQVILIICIILDLKRLLMLFLPVLVIIPLHLKITDYYMALESQILNPLWERFKFC